MRALTSLLLVVASAVVVVAAGGCRTSAEPFASMLINVDTDVAVPRLVSNLRVDVFRDGAWIDSRDVPLRDPRFLPASFGVFSSNTTAASSSSSSGEALVRLRGYGDGALVDVPPDAPRLMQNGADVTPPRDPDPALAIDQLVRVSLVSGEQHQARVVLFGACAGIAADLTSNRTCASADGTQVDAPQAVDDDHNNGNNNNGNNNNNNNAPGSRAGTFGVDSSATPTPTPRVPAANDDGGEVLVPGGAFVLGSRDLAANTEWSGIQVSGIPPRLIVISSFLMDRYEVSVGRFRRALAQGFKPPVMPSENNAAFPSTLANALATEQFCTYSASPRPTTDPGGSREPMPLSCVTWDTARAFCISEGGDLPSEADWEYAATAALRPAKTSYPFGDDDPVCAGSVFSRTTYPDIELSECSVEDGFPPGPTRVGVTMSDVTPSSASTNASDGGGIHDLGGNVAEWTRDVYRDYSDPCWTNAPQRDPKCVDGTGDNVVRGGAFTEPRAGMFSALRKPAHPTLPYSGIGFRCIRRGPLP